MTFAAPLFLWTLLMAIPLAAIYLLKVRPTRKPVTALFLYQRLFSERRSTRLFKRLRDLWSLLLMLLALVALSFALARPQFTKDDRKDLLILIDHSASMNARDGRGSRLDAAQALATDIIRAMNGRQRAAVAAVADTTVVLAHLTGNPRELTDAVAAIEPTHRPLHIESIASLTRDADATARRRVLLISDGCGRQFELPQTVELLTVGGPTENVGIVAADMQRMGSNEWRVFVQVLSTHAQPIDVELSLEHDAILTKLVPMQVQPGLNRPQIHTVNGGPGRWLARLRVDDALAADNEVCLVTHPPKPVRVRVDATNHTFFEHCVAAFSPSGLLHLAEDNPEIVIASGTLPDVPLALIFQPIRSGSWWSSVGEGMPVAAPRILVDDHPVLRFLDVPSMPFAGAREVTLPEHAVVIVESERGLPLIWQAGEPDHRAIVVNMDPTASEFFFSVRFPILVHAAVTHLSGRREPLAAVYATGASAPIPGAHDSTVTAVTLPATTSTTAQGTHFGPLPETGFYEFSNDAGTWLVSAAVVNPAESMLCHEDVVATAQPIARGLTPHAWFIVLAIGVILFECLLYHRRIVG